MFNLIDEYGGAACFQKEKAELSSWMNNENLYFPLLNLGMTNIMLQAWPHTFDQSFSKAGSVCNSNIDDSIHIYPEDWLVHVCDHHGWSTTSEQAS